MIVVIRRMKAIALCLCWLVCTATAGEVNPETVFRNPPQLAKPGVWWHWMGCNVSSDVCTPWAAHIENSPTDGLIAFTEPWWKLVRHAVEEGKRLNLNMGIHNCPGYTHSGGPWIPPELSMLEVCHSKTPVKGGETWKGKLPRPEVDRYCISCHGLGGSDDPKAKQIDLTGKRIGPGKKMPGDNYTASYDNLARFGKPRLGHVGYSAQHKRNISRPRDFYAYRNKVSHMLLKNHGKCNMDDDSRMRITEWMDMNYVFFGDLFPTSWSIAG